MPISAKSTKKRSYFAACGYVVTYIQPYFSSYYSSAVLVVLLELPSRWLVGWSTGWFRGWFAESAAIPRHYDGWRPVQRLMLSLDPATRCWSKYLKRMCFDFLLSSSSTHVYACARIACIYFARIDLLIRNWWNR